MFVSSRVRFIIIGSVSLGLAACSTSHPRRATHGFDYLAAKSAPELVVPKGMTKPVTTPSYQIPNVRLGSSSVIGKQVNVQPPEQVIGLVSGQLSVDPQTQQPMYIFDRVKATSSEQSRAWLVSQLKAYAHHYNGELQSVDDKGLIWKSSPLIERHQYDTGLFSSSDVEIKSQFRYQLAPRHQGRQIGLTPQAISYQSSADQGNLSNSHEQHQVERQELNRVIRFVAAQEAKKESQAKVHTKAKVMLNSIELVIENNDGIEILLAKDSIHHVLPALEKALSTLGFKVSGYVSQSGTMTVDYSRPSASDLAAYGVKPVPLASGTYKLTIGQVDGNTQITVSDDDGVLSAQRIEKLYPSLKTLLANAI